jgi:hypothetical protein
MAERDIRFVPLTLNTGTQNDLLATFEAFRRLNSSSNLTGLGFRIAGDTEGPPTEHDTQGGKCDDDPGKCDDDPAKDTTSVIAIM